MVKQTQPMDRRVAVMFAAGLMLGAGLAAWAVWESKAPQPVETGAPPLKAAEAVKPSSPAPQAATTAVATHVHVACPAGPVIAAASRDDGLMQLRGAPASTAEISALLLRGKEAAAAGRTRDAELTFLAACKAADQLQRADASERTDARYQLARHYAHYVLVGNAPAASRAELVKRADVLYSDAAQAYRARLGEEHEKTRFAFEGLAALQQSQAVAQTAAAQTAPAAPIVAAAPLPPPKAVAVVELPAPKPVAVRAAAPPQVAAQVSPNPKTTVAVEPRRPRPAIASRPLALETPAPAAVAQVRRPRRATRPVEPEPDVIEAPVRQASGGANRRDDQ